MTLFVHRTPGWKPFIALVVILPSVFAAGAADLGSSTGSRFAGTPACGKWALLQTSDAPSPRGRAHTILDPVRNRIVLFGGFDSDLRDDVWTLSLATGAWTPLDVSGTPPRPSYHGNAFYDPIRDRMIVVIEDQIWALTLDGTPAWSQLQPLDVPNIRHSLRPVDVYDPVRDRVLKIGRGDESENEVWSLALANSPLRWERMTTLDTPAGWLGRAIYDPQRDRVLLLGEWKAPNPYLWALELSGTPRWTQLMSLEGLATLHDGAMVAYDPVRDRLLSFGGHDWNFPFGLKVETWAIALKHGPARVELSPDVGASPPVEYGSVVFDPASDRLVMFGGFDSRAATKFSNASYQLPFGLHADIASEPFGKGVISRSPSVACHDLLSTVTVAARPLAGYTFDHWSGDLSGSANPAEVRMDGYRAITAHFSLGPPLITRFTPLEGQVYTVVEIFGGSFTGTTRVEVGGGSVPFTVVSDSCISVTLQPWAADGPITALTPSGWATSAVEFHLVPSAGGVNLSWDDCGTHGIAVKSFACGSNEGESFSLIASFVPPPNVTQFVGIYATMAVMSAGTLPDWWKFGRHYCRDTTGIMASVDFSSGPSSCTDPYAAAKGRAQAAIDYNVGFASPNRARLRVVSATPDPVSLDTNQEYFAFRVNISRTRTENCTGCAVPLCISLNQLMLLQPEENGYQPDLIVPRDRAFVSWQSTPSDCPLSTPIQAAVITTDIDADHVRVVWLAGRLVRAILERRVADGPWRFVTHLETDGDHHFIYDDHDVTPGTTYGYRLVIRDSGEPQIIGETSIVVPAHTRLAIGNVKWDRNGRGGVVSCSLPRRGAARLEVFDVTGRRWARQILDGLGAGQHEVRVSAPLRLASGVYFLRLLQGPANAERRLVLIP